MNTGKRKRNILVTTGLLAAVFIAIISVFNSVVDEVKNARQTAVEQVRERDFKIIWDYLLTLSEIADKEVYDIAENLESDIRNSLDLDELEKALDSKNDTNVIYKQLHAIIVNNVSDVHFGGIVNNNRNAVMVLDGFDHILEDYFLDVQAREPGKPELHSDYIKFSDYARTTYNEELFRSAMTKIRTKSDLPIAIEPYNYLGEDHIKITEVSYDQMKDVYIKEGMEGLKNYQFMAPAYITKNGDIFGNKDIEAGINQDTHKFIVIQFYNLYDQIDHVDKHHFESDQDILVTEERYSRILEKIYLFGTIMSSAIVIIILFFVAVFNKFVEENDEEDK